MRLAGTVLAAAVLVACGETAQDRMDECVDDMRTSCETENDPVLQHACWEYVNDVCTEESGR